MIGLDTNILLRYIAQDDEVQSAQASAILEEHLTPEKPGFISSTVLVEMCWTLRRLYKVDRSELMRVLERLLKSAELSFEHREEAWKALQLMRTQHADFADALAGLVHQKFGCSKTLTFDKEAAKMDFFEEVA